WLKRSKSVAARMSCDTVPRRRRSLFTCQSRPHFQDQISPLPVYSAARAATKRLSSSAARLPRSSGSCHSVNASFTSYSPCTFATVEFCIIELRVAMFDGTPRSAGANAADAGKTLGSLDGLLGSQTICSISSLRQDTPKAATMGPAQPSLTLPLAEMSATV